MNNPSRQAAEEGRRQARIAREVRRCRFAQDAGRGGCHACPRRCGRYQRPVERDECEACVLSRFPELRPRSWSPPAWLDREPSVPAPLSQVPPPMKLRVKPAGLVQSPDEKPAPFADLYRGASAFLLCGGPSLRSLDLALLERRRGFLLAAVNNAPAVREPDYLKPDLWFSVDAPYLFIPNIWMDPAIAKFIPQTRRRDRTRVQARGTNRDGKVAVDHPNVWTYRRHGAFDPAAFLWEPVISWGTDRAHVDPEGHGNCRSVLFVALRLLHWMGVATVYLVGADFAMRPESPYAWGQRKAQSGCDHSNRSYAIMDRRLAMLRPHFEAASFEVLNATPGGALTALDRIRYPEAIARASVACSVPVESSGL